MSSLEIGIPDAHFETVCLTKFWPVDIFVKEY